MKLRFLCLSMITFLLFGAFSALGMDCKIPPLVDLAVTPNVLIIFDTSGSMLTEDIPGYENRLVAAKTVITQLLSDPVSEGFRWGLMRLDGSRKSGIHSQWDWQDPDGKVFKTDSEFRRHGGKLLRPVGTDRAEIIDYVSVMQTYDTVPHIYTNSGEALFTAAQYFAGGNGPPGLGTYKGDNVGPDFTNYQYHTLSGTKYWARDTDDWGNAIDSSSPITDYCQKNFVVYLTDGMSNCDSDWPRVLNLVGDYDGDGVDSPDVPEMDETGANNYMDDIAKWMYENDLRTDDDTMPGIQSVVTYVVGLQIDSQLLHDTGDENHGRGGFYYAGDYDQLRDAFQTIVNDIMQRIASGTAVAVQSTSTQGNRRLLRAKFVPKAWTGHLEAFDLPYTQGDVPLWDAGIELQAMNADNRSIFTALDDKEGVPLEKMKRKVLFTEGNSGAEDADKIKLSDLLGAADDAEAKKIIRYIRGESVAGYRVRPDGWKLGDIAYSSPVLWKDMVFVGANDGMLHAFDINTGQEKWAFIPNNLLGKLKDLTLPEYCHEYFVDLSPKVADVYVGGVKKTVLVGGERGGGDAFFALDITDPSADGVQPMWEFTDEYLGESWTLPTVNRCWLGGAERWVVFVGSTFNTKDSKGYLFAVDVATGEKIGNQRCLADAPENCLPSVRTIDFDQDGYTDKIYVGTFTGSLYLVEVAKDAAADPSGKGWTDKHILSVQKDQPITIPTSLSLYRELGVTNVMAYFGTGKYFDLTDKDDKTLQSFYAVKDNAVKVGIGGLANQTDASTCTPIQDKFGWYMDLDKNPGERVISSALVLGGYVFFATFQPSDDPCEAGGIARLYFVNYENGCVPAGPVIDADGDGDVDGDDMDDMIDGRSIEIGYGLPSDIVFDPSGSTIIIQTSDTTIHVFKVDVGNLELMIHSWREVIN